MESPWCSILPKIKNYKIKIYSRGFNNENIKLGTYIFNVEVFQF